MQRQAIVIGTGAGGLTAAAYLAKEGFDVTALEQAPHLGGLLAGFVREGFYFDPGVHYIGGCGPGGLVRNVLEPLGVNCDESFVEIDPDGYDVLRFPDQEVRVCKGVAEFRARLSATFPEHDLEVCDFMSLLGTMRDLSHVADPQGHPSLLTLGINLPSLLRWARASYAELLDHLISEPRLRSILSAAVGDEALPPSEASALYTLMFLAHYTDGAYFPRGGSCALRDELVARAKGFGVKFVTDTRVRAIVAEGGRAKRVETDEGESYAADFVVSDLDPRTTVAMLSGTEIPRKMRKKLEHARSSSAPFLLFLGIQGDLAARGLPQGNVWSYPSWDVEACYAAVRQGKIPDDPMLFLSSPSLKEGSGTLAPPGAHSLEILTFVPYSAFAPYIHLREDVRGPEYVAIKKLIEQRMLDAVGRRFPGLLENTLFCQAATPITFQSWVGLVDGGAYGPAETPDFWGPFRFETRSWLPNLFFAGAGALGHGVAPSLLSGKLAAIAVERATHGSLAAKIGSTVF